MVDASITGADMKTSPSIAPPSSRNAESAVRASKHDPQITKRRSPCRARRWRMTDTTSSR